MDLFVVVLAQLLLLFGAPRSYRFLNISGGILGADHKTNLARRISGDGGVSVFDNWEDFFAIFLELGDEGQMKPLVLGCRQGC